jgi:hypothetical protein
MILNPSEGLERSGPWFNVLPEMILNLSEGLERLGRLQNLPEMILNPPEGLERRSLGVAQPG